MPKGKDKKDFKLYKDQRGSFEKLTDEEAGKLIKHLFKYVNCEDPVPDDRLTELMFEPIRQTLERDLIRWKNKCKKNSENIRKRWHTEEYERIKNDTKHTDSHSHSHSHRDKKILNKESKERKVFKKPELSEVVQYFLNQEMPEIEANSFHDYYEANGWKVGRNPMKNWQAAVRNWKKNYKGYGKTVKLGTSEARIAAIKNF